MSPSEALKKANEQLIENNTVEMFVTVWLAVFNIRTGKGIAANAGHEHPALRRNGGLFEMIKYKHAPAVGMIEGIQFKEHGFDLAAGDTLFVYTDGATEATNESDEFFGEERLLAALNDYPDAEPEDVLVYVKNCIDEFVGEAPQFDDITMLAFKYNGSKLSLDEVRDNM
jgi:sigma-B regulation protein RsbU (phosphoserine phosphatase)